MKLKKLMKVLHDGSACISIINICCEYDGGVKKLKEEEFYKKIKNRKVKEVAVGQGTKAPEVCIVLEDD